MMSSFQQARSYPGFSALGVVLMSGCLIVGASQVGCKHKHSSVAVGITATKLAFVVGPGTATIGLPFSPPVRVEIRDAAGSLVSGATNAVTLSIGTNPSGGTLSGTITVAAAGGVAVFSTLAIDLAGTGYTLVASAAGLAGDTSGLFDVTTPQVTTFGCTPPRVQITATANLNWTVVGNPVLTLDPGAINVTGLNGMGVTPFPAAPAGADPRITYKIRSTAPSYLGERTELAWAKSAGGSGQDYAMGVSSLPGGAFLVTGSFNGTMTLGAGEANQTLLTSAGNSDIFLARYNPNGTLAWAKRAGGTSPDEGYNVAALPDGSCAVVGYFSGTATFGLGELNQATLSFAGGTDIFLARYNSDGTLAWVRQASGPQSESAAQVAVLPDGDMVIAGSFPSSVSFGSGEPNQTVLTSVGLSDVLIARYRQDGKLVWARQAGGVGDEECFRIAACPDGTFFITGQFSGSATFGAGEPNQTILASAGGADLFVARYDGGGRLIWAKSAGGSGQEQGWAVAAFPDGSAVVTGVFDASATFGPGEANQTVLASAGSSDAFLARYNADGTLAWAKRAGGAFGDRGYGLTLFGDESIAVGGAFHGDAIFGTGEPNQTTLSAAGGSDDCFVARYSGAGLLLWVQREGGTGVDGIGSLSGFPDGSFIAVGSFNSSATFGPGDPGQSTLTSAGVADVFVARFSPVNYRLQEVRPEGLACVVSAGSAGDEIGYGTAALSDGGFVVTGSFEGGTTFGAGQAGQTTLVAAGGTDIFVARYSANGTLVWAKRAGGTNYEGGYGIAALADGGLIVVGGFQGSATFGPGEPGQTILTSPGSSDIFISRYNADGTLAWAKREGAASGETTFCVGAFPGGSFVIAGNFSGSTTLGPGEAGQTVLTSAGGDDVVLARFNTDGTLAWAKRAGGSNYEYASAISSFSDGSCVVTGYYEGTAVFGPGEAAQTTLTLGGVRDIFVARYNSDGTLAWAKRAGGSASQTGNAVAAFSDGACVVVGMFQNSATFGPGEPGQTILTMAGGVDVFVARYRPDGTLEWAKRAGGTGFDLAYAVGAFADGGSAVAGYFSGSATFGAGEANQTVMTASGTRDLFVARFAQDGSLVWAKRAGGSGADTAYGIAAFGDGSVVVTGSIENAATFGQGESNAASRSSAGLQDFFAAKYFPYGP